MNSAERVPAGLGDGWWAEMGRRNCWLWIREWMLVRTARLAGMDVVGLNWVVEGYQGKIWVTQNLPSNLKVIGKQTRKHG